MKLGAHSLVWVSPFTTESLWIIDRLRKLGGEAIDISYGWDAKPFDLNETRKALEACQMEASLAGNINASRDLTSTEPAIRQAGFEYLKNCLEICVRIGAKRLIGPLHAELRKSVLLTSDEKKTAWGNCIESLRRAAQIAEQQGVAICVEVLNRFESSFLTTVDDGLRLVNDVGSPAVKLLLDTFHLNIEEKNIPGAIRKAGSALGHLHACENDRGIPGTGHVDWKGVAAAVKATGFDGCLTIESFNPDVPALAQRTGIFRRLAPDQDTLVREGLQFLRSLFH